MKKTILMLAGIAVLASCAKEIAPDVYEQAPVATGKFTIVADRGDNTDTKVAYDPTEAALKDRSTWKASDKLGIFTYEKKYNPADKKTTISWTNYPVSNNEIANPFKTNALFEGKTSAAFTGALTAFSGYIYGVYPEAVMPVDNEGDAITKITGDAGDNEASSLEKAEEKAAEDLVLTFEYKEDGNEFGSAAVGVEGKKYLKNEHDADNIVLLFRSNNDNFKLTEEQCGENGLTTSLPSLTAKYLSSRIHLTIHKDKNADADMNDEWAILKSVKITALDGNEEEVAAFHKEMKINLLDFDEINKLESSNNNPLDVLYKNADADSKVESLEFNIECPEDVTEDTEEGFYKLDAEESVVLPLIIFPTDKFEYIQCEVTWINNAYQEQVTETRLDWGKASARRLVCDTKKWTVDLPISDATKIKIGDDARELVRSALEKGKTHIVIEDVPSLALYDHPIDDGDYVEKFGSKQAALLIPKAASDKEIVIEGYLRDNGGDTFTIAFAEDYTCGENGSVTFIMKNNADLTKTTVILDNAKGSIVLKGGQKYKEVKVKEVKDFTLAADAATLAIADDANAEKIVIAGNVDDIETSANCAPTIKKIVIAEEGMVPTLNAKDVPNVEINGKVGTVEEGEFTGDILTVYPTEGDGTKVTVGEDAEIGSIITIPATGNYASMKYDEFVISGTLTTEDDNTLDTQNAPFVEINGDLSPVNVIVNATAGDGTVVKIGADATVNSLAPSDAADDETYASFTIDGTISNLAVTGTPLDTKGAKTVTIGSKATYNASVPALKTTKATTVTIGKGATVASLDPDKATKITINGTITGAANEFGLKSLEAETVTLGKDGSIGGNVWIAPAADNPGKEVTLNGEITGNVTVSNFEKFTAGSKISSWMEISNISETVDITIGANDNTVTFHNCKGEINVEDGREADGSVTPALVFHTCTDANVTLTDLVGTTNNTQTIAEVKDITIDGGDFRRATLTAGGNVTVKNNAKISTAKITAANGDVKIDGKKSNTPMNAGQIYVYAAQSLKMKYVDFNADSHLYSYVNAELTDCEVTAGTTLANTNKLTHMWKSDATDTYDSILIKLVYKDRGADVSQGSIKNLFTKPATVNADGWEGYKDALESKAMVEIDKDNVDITYSLSDWKTRN